MVAFDIQTEPSTSAAFYCCSALSVSAARRTRDQHGAQSRPNAV